MTVPHEVHVLRIVNEALRKDLASAQASSAYWESRAREAEAIASQAMEVGRQSIEELLSSPSGWDGGVSRTWHWYEGASPVCGASAPLSELSDRRKQLPKGCAKVCKRCLKATER